MLPRPDSPSSVTRGKHQVLDRLVSARLPTAGIAGITVPEHSEDRHAQRYGDHSDTEPAR